MSNTMTPPSAPYVLLYEANVLTYHVKSPLTMIQSVAAIADPHVTHRHRARSREGAYRYTIERPSTASNHNNVQRRTPATACIHGLVPSALRNIGSATA